MVDPRRHARACIEGGWSGPSLVDPSVGVRRRQRRAQGAGGRQTLAPQDALASRAPERWMLSFNKGEDLSRTVQGDAKKHVPDIRRLGLRSALADASWGWAGGGVARYVGREREGGSIASRFELVAVQRVRRGTIRQQRVVLHGR